MFGALGGYVGYNWIKWEKEMLAAVNIKRKEVGMPPYATPSVVPALATK